MCEKGDLANNSDLYEEMRLLVSRAKGWDSEAISVLYRLSERRLKGAAKKKLGKSADSARKLYGRALNRIEEILKDAEPEKQDALKKDEKESGDGSPPK